jgi:hypothetical protein
VLSWHLCLEKQGAKKDLNNFSKLNKLLSMKLGMHQRESMTLENVSGGVELGKK